MVGLSRWLRAQPAVRRVVARGVLAGNAPSRRALERAGFVCEREADGLTWYGLGVRVDGSLEGIDWVQAKADLAADQFDNGRSAAALRLSFEASQHVAIAREGDRVVGMARALSDGVSNAYVLDVWTASAYRRQGIASRMVQRLVEQVPGQHLGLQTDNAQQFYESLGFRPQPDFWSRVSGTWLDNDAKPLTQPNVTVGRIRRDAATRTALPRCGRVGTVEHWYMPQRPSSPREYAE